LSINGRFWVSTEEVRQHKQGVEILRYVLFEAWMVFDERLDRFLLALDLVDDTHRNRHSRFLLGTSTLCSFTSPAAAPRLLDLPRGGGRSRRQLRREHLCGSGARLGEKGRDRSLGVTIGRSALPVLKECLGRLLIARLWRRERASPTG